MKRLFLKLIFVILLAALVLPLSGVTQAGAAAGSAILAASQVKNLKGVYKGGLASLKKQDQIGTKDDPAKYVLFQTPGAYYRGYAVLTLPSHILPANVNTMKINVNYKGPKKSAQRWMWYLYDWQSKTWVLIGDNSAARLNAWSPLTFSVSNTSRYLRSDGRIHLMLRSSNSNGDAKIDLLRVGITYSITSAGPAFPRLGMWWPDPWKQSNADIARYDFVALDDYQAEFITPLKDANPNIKLLTSTNACELAFTPGEANPSVRNIPAAWFLTQVGTTLRAAVNSTQTIIPVNAVTKVQNGVTYQLFEAGDAVLVQGESMMVNSVDAVNKTLSVQRGYIRPASSHTAGVRIAAHISFWPNSWVMNLSTLSSRAVYDSAVGAESWAEYNARVSARQLTSEPRWSGILIDRADGNQSWLVDGGYARTIDPNQSNTLPASYSQFDTTWNSGLRILESKLRQQVGSNTIIYTNWGFPNYDLLNGTNLEGFPLDTGGSYGAPWHQSMFGPRPDIGAYFDWTNKSLSPNLTMVETYEDDSSPSSYGSGVYINPYEQPGFVPNYRKMRFGLGSALLNDGYFSYEINTNGHGSLGLMWFDEYDNAGAGRGYLGLPLGNMTRALDSLPASNLVTGGGFNSSGDLANWSVWNDAGYASSYGLDASNPAEGAAALKLNITQSAGVDWKAALIHQSFAIENGKQYSLTFKARADTSRTMRAWVSENGGNYDTWLDFWDVPLTTEWQDFTLTASATGASSNAALYFALGERTGTIWIDDVKLQEGSLDVWRRDFEHGIVLVNPTQSTVIIPLGGEFRKINGTQDPIVNDGSTVTSVTLQPLDSIILLRP